MDYEVKSITLTLTNACNLKCSYCYEHNKGIDYMSFNTAKRIIDQNLGDGKNTPITIDLFGGEPFMAFSLIKEVCEYTWSKDWNREYRFFVSTNGTLIHGDILDWVEKNKDRFWCGLSYDGTISMQNANRSNSAAQIDLSFFSRNWPTQGVKMTVSEKSIESLADGVIFLHNQGFNVNCNLAYGLDWSDDSLKSIYETQLNKLIEFYIEHPSVLPCSLLNMSIIYCCLNKGSYTKWCGAGTNMKVYYMDGTCYPCHYFEPMTLGEKKAKEALSIDFKNINGLMDKDCKDCCLLSICPTCYGNNYASTGDVSKKDKNLCALTKIQALANSYFQYRLIKAGRIESKEKRKQLTDAIIRIQSEFA